VADETGCLNKKNREKSQKPEGRVAAEIKKTRKAPHKLVQTAEIKEYAAEKGSYTKQVSSDVKSMAPVSMRVPRKEACSSSNAPYDLFGCDLPRFP
jgi:hypothetical protein